LLQVQRSFAYAICGFLGKEVLGIVHKLRLQEEVGSWSKNVNFYNVETVNKGVGGQKSQKLVNVVCE